MGVVFGQQICYFNFVVFCYCFLNIVDGDQFFLQCQQIVQCFVYEIDGDCLVGEVGVGDNVIQCFFQFMYV